MGSVSPVGLLVDVIKAHALLQRVGIEDFVDAGWQGVERRPAACPQPQSCPSETEL